LPAARRCATNDGVGCVVTGFGLVSPRLGGAGEAGEKGWEIPTQSSPADKRGRIGRLDRLCRLFLSASYLAVDDASLAPGEVAADRIGLSFGTGLGCLLTNAEFYQKVVEQGPKAASPRLFAYTVSSAAAGEVSIALGITGPNATQHAGIAAGLAAVGYGFDLIEMGRADVVLAGGADACGPALIEALGNMGLVKARGQARPFADAVPGVVPSEGAGILVLEGAQSAARRGVAPRASIAGYAAGFEPSLASAAPRSGGIAATMRRALTHAGVEPDGVDLVVASAHGTPCDAAELAAIREVIGDRAEVWAPKAEGDEAFAASAVLGMARALDRNGAAVVVVNSLCYSGNVVSLVLTR
jgi:3-oxoacyl-[acyl-carrier-protein] synthase II